MAAAAVAVSNIAGETASFQVREGESVSALKQKIAQEWKVPPRYQELLFKTTILADGDVLPACEDGLNLVVSMEAVREDLEAGGWLRQVTALTNLEVMGSKIAIAFVCSLLEDDGVNVAAVHALGRIAHGDAQALALIEKRLTHEEELVRECAVEAVSKVAERGDGRAVGLLVACAGDESTRVRRAVLDALPFVADRGDAAPLSAVEKCLDDDCSQVRWAAVRSLQLLAVEGDEHAVNLLKASAADSSWLVRNAAAEALPALAKKGDEEVVSLLIAQIGKEDDSQVRETLQFALLQLAEEERCKGPLAHCFGPMAPPMIPMPGSTPVVMSMNSRNF